MPFVIRTFCGGSNGISGPNGFGFSGFVTEVASPTLRGGGGDEGTAGVMCGFGNSQVRLANCRVSRQCGSRERLRLSIY